MLMTLAAGGVPVVAQSDSSSSAPSDPLAEWATRPLEIRLAISLVTLDGDIIMKLDQSQPTEPGRAVGATLVQENRLRVEALFTPFWNTETELILHVQGQIWVGDSEGGYGDEPVASAYRAMPVALGDSVLFFPLGGERELQGSTRRFHFRSEPFPVDPVQRHEAEDGPVAVVIVMAVQVDLYQENGAAEQLEVVS
jgi:hypothetical protein